MWKRQDEKDRIWEGGKSTVSDFFQAELSKFVKSLFWQYISTTNHPGKGLDPSKLKKMPSWTWRFVSKKVHKPSI